MTADEALMVLQVGVGLAAGSLAVFVLAALWWLVALWFRDNPAWVPPAPFQAPDKLWLHPDGEITRQWAKGSLAIEYKRSGVVYRSEARDE